MNTTICKITAVTTLGIVGGYLIAKGLVDLRESIKTAKETEELKKKAETLIDENMRKLALELYCNDVVDGLYIAVEED